MNYQTHILPNGLRIIHHPFPSQISYCGFAINTGTRDEMDDEHGMAHFVEHLLFKGTKKRKAHHITSRMENVGGDLSAYTTKEETFLYATFLEEHFPRAVELLTDIILNSEFSPFQVDRERDVVLDEINSYHDSPSEQIYDDFENMLFAGHDLGHYILGNPTSLQTFDSEKVHRFVTRQYHPSRMIFFSFGKTPFEKVIKRVEQHFTVPNTPCRAKKRTLPLIIEPKTESFKKNTTQTHIMIGFRTIDMHHPMRYPLYLLNHVLGGGSLNSRFNVSLREKHGLVYHVESGTTLYSDTGLFTVYFACDPKHTERCVRLVQKEIDRLRNQSLTTMQLSLAKKQWKGQIGIAAENNENNAIRMAKNFLHTNESPPIEEIFTRIDAITTSQLSEMANLLFSDSFFRLEYK